MGRPIMEHREQLALPNMGVVGNCLMYSKMDYRAEEQSTGLEIPPLKWNMVGGAKNPTSKNRNVPYRPRLGRISIVEAARSV